MSRVIEEGSLLGSTSQPAQCGPTDARRVRECIPAPLYQLQTSAETVDYIEQFETLTGQSRTMIWMFGPDALGKIFNTSWLEFRGRTLEEERGNGWTEGIHAEDRDCSTASFLYAFEARQPFQIQFRVKRPDDSYSTVIGQGVPQYLLNGSFMGYAGSLWEIQPEESGFHQAGNTMGHPTVRQELCQMAVGFQTDPAVSAGSLRWTGNPAVTRNKFRTCLDASSNPIVVLDQFGNCVYCNADPRTAARKTMLKSAPPKESIDCPQEIQVRLDSNAEFDIGEMQVLAQPIRTGDRRTAFSIVDTSDRKRAQPRERAFLHDITNAAAGIQMLIDLLKQDISDRERAEYVRLLDGAANRLVAEIQHEKTILDSSVTQTLGVLRQVL